MTTLADNRQGAEDRSASNTAAQPVISSNEYEVSNLYDSSLALSEQDGILQPVLHILHEDTSEAEDFDVSSDNEKYKLVDDISDGDFTVDMQDATDSDDDDDGSDVCVEKKTRTVAPAQKQYTFHEYTQTPSSKNLVVKRMDESSGPLICRWNDCGKEYNSPEELSKHLDFQHDLSDWICHWMPCSRNLKPFDARYKLIVHLRCHTGEKPYKCSIPGCTRKFSRIENMRLHVRTHTGEKPYACSYEGCPKRFNNSSDRAKHVKTHVQTKPYKCKFPGCDKHYTDPSSMRKHFRSIHFRSDQNKQNKNNLRIHNYGAALPAKQPRIAPGPTVNGNNILTPVNNERLTADQTVTQISSTVMANSNANCNNKLVQVPVFQLPPKSESSPGRSDMSQLIQEGKIQPILLQNGDQQSMLMFVPTANMHEATGSGITMIPVLSHHQQQLVSQPPTQNTPSSTSTTSSSSSDTLTTTTEQPVLPNRPAKNVHVIVSSSRSKEHENNQSTADTA